MSAVDYGLQFEGHEATPNVDGVRRLNAQAIIWERKLFDIVGVLLEIKIWFHWEQSQKEAGESEDSIVNRASGNLFNT